MAGNANGWLANQPSLAVVEQRGDLARLLVPADVDLQAILAAASAAGEIRRFAFQPPSLSELFMEVVRS